MNLTPLGKAMLIVLAVGLLWLIVGDDALRTARSLTGSLNLGPIDWMVLIALAFIVARLGLIAGPRRRTP